MGKENTYKPQKLWFIDKNTGEKAVVSAEKIENGKITFSYQGKQYTIPVSMLGKKVYACLPEKPQAKGSVEKEIFYQGEYFKWVNDQWVSSSGYILKEKYQNRLSSLYQKRRGHYGHPVKDLIAFARKQGKDEVGIHTAIRSLEIAMLRASAGEAKSFLATLCSLYRQTNSPNGVRLCGKKIRAAGQNSAIFDFGLRSIHGHWRHRNGEPSEKQGVYIERRQRY